MAKIKKIISSSKNYASVSILAGIRVIITILKHIQLILLIICFIGVWHYFCVFYPRFITIDDHYSRIQNLGIDYWGIIIGFIALIVTLLVGWNIYNTIKIKDDVKSYRKRLNEIANVYKRRMDKLLSTKLQTIENRLDEFDKCCKKRGSEINNINKLFEKRLITIEAQTAINTASLYINAAQKLSGKDAIRMYEKAYKELIDVLVLYSKIRASKREYDDCIKYAMICLTNIKESNIPMPEIIYNYCTNALSRLLKNKRIRNMIKEGINDLLTLQSEVPVKTTTDSVFDFILSIQKNK